MATRFDNTLQMSNSTDALWRAWVQFIHDTLITTGTWSDAGDAGQMTIATSLHPTVANTKVGFRLYKMNDALAVANPVFMRVDYGSGTAANGPGIWITIGTGSNGTGTVTNITFNGGSSGSPTVQSAANATSACNSYGSADSGRIQLMMFVRAGANDLMIMSLERTKDATGADTGTGLLFSYGSAGRLDTSFFIIRAGGSQPPGEAGVNLIISNQATSAFAGDVGVGIPMHFRSVAQQPGLGTIAVNSGDFLAQATPSLTLYGSVRTYQLGDSNASQVAVAIGAGTISLRASTRVGIRFD